MGRITKKELELKIKATHEAIAILKEKTTTKKNLLTVPNVVQLVNCSVYSKSFSKNLSEGSIKKPRNEEFVKIKDIIHDFKDEYKESKKNLNSKIKDLEKRLESVLQVNINLVDQKSELQEQLQQKEKLLEKIKKERDELHKTISNKEA